MKKTHAFAVLATAAYAGMFLLHDFSENFGLFLVFYFVAWFAMLGTQRFGLPAWIFWTGAVLFRALLLNTPPTLSDDVFRYVWEGHIQNHGFNPYLLAPASPQLEALRNEIWSSINHPDASAIYPAMAQWMFRFWALFGGVTLFKLALCVCDLVLIYVIVRLLRRKQLPLRRAALYAWNPLVVVETAGSGHLEPLGLLGLFAAFACRRQFLVGLALAASIATKYLAAVLLPLWWQSGRLRLAGTLLMGLTMLLLTLPFANAGWHLFDSLWLYASKWRHNDLAFYLLFTWSGSLLKAKIVAAGLWLTGLFLLLRCNFDIYRKSLWLLTLLLFLSPTIHPWYLLWPVAFLPLAPQASILAWSGSVVLAYGFSQSWAGLGPFAADSWIPRAFELGPPLLAAAFGHRWASREKST